MSEQYVFCGRCNRRLKSAASKEIGYGPACARIDGIIPSKFRGKVENASFSVGVVRGDNIDSFCLAYFTGGEKKDAIAKHPAFLGDRLAYYFEVRELWSHTELDSNYLENKFVTKHIPTYLYDKDEKLYEVQLYQQKDLFGGYAWIADLQEVTAVPQLLMDAVNSYLEKAKV